MIHFPDTAPEVTGVVRAIRLPVPAQTTPAWAAVLLAHEYLLGIELLKTRAVGVLIAR